MQIPRSGITFRTCGREKYKLHVIENKQCGALEPGDWDKSRGFNTDAI